MTGISTSFGVARVGSSVMQRQLECCVTSFARQSGPSRKRDVIHKMADRDHIVAILMNSKSFFRICKDSTTSYTG